MLLRDLAGVGGLQQHGPVEARGGRRGRRESCQHLALATGAAWRVRVRDSSRQRHYRLGLMTTSPSPADLGRFAIGFDHRDRARLHALWDDILDAESGRRGR